MDTKSNSNKAVEAGIGYTIGNVLVKCIGFLSLPIFSRIMTTEQFGVYNVFVSYESILFVIIGVAMHSSIQSANLKYKDKLDDYTSSISLIYLLNLVFLLAISFWFGDQISLLLDFDKPILSMLIVYSFSGAILSLYNNRLSVNYSYKKYLFISIFNSLGNVALSLILMLTIFSERREYGRIVGSTVSIFAVATVILILQYRKACPKVSKEYWKFGLKYSLPIVPHGISQVLLAQVDRIMIRSFVGNAAAGIFSLAGNIKLILTVISDSISTAWKTWFYGELKKGNRNKIQTTAKQVCGLYTIFAVGLISISPELIYILGGEGYSDSVYVAIPMIIDAFILFVYSIVVQSEYYTGRTKFIMIGTIIAAVIDVILNYFLIQQFGFIAAAYTTLFAYICYLALHYLISYRLVHFFVLPLRWLFVYIVIIAFIAIFCLINVEALLLRWLMCGIIVVPLSVWLLKTSGYLDRVRAKIR